MYTLSVVSSTKQGNEEGGVHAERGFIKQKKMRVYMPSIISSDKRGNGGNARDLVRHNRGTKKEVYMRSRQKKRSE